MVVLMAFALVFSNSLLADEIVFEGRVASIDRSDPAKTLFYEQVEDKVFRISYDGNSASKELLPFRVPDLDVLNVVEKRGTGSKVVLYSRRSSSVFEVQFSSDYTRQESIALGGPFALTADEKFLGYSPPLGEKMLANAPAASRVFTLRGRRVLERLLEGNYHWCGKWLTVEVPLTQPQVLVAEYNPHPNPSSIQLVFLHHDGNLYDAFYATKKAFWIIHPFQPLDYAADSAREAKAYRAAGLEVPREPVIWTMHTPRSQFPYPQDANWKGEVRIGKRSNEFRGQRHTF